MPAIMSSPPDRRILCPFCGLRFVRVSNHLPHCKQRQGRDYSSFLAKQSSSVAGKGRGICPKCGRLFRRLDTHLRVSASCRDITSGADTCRVAPAPAPAPALASTATAPAMNNTNIPSTAHTFKRPLKLPKHPEQWAEADWLLQVQVVPEVLQASSAEEKNVVFCNRVYEVLATRFGTRSPPRSQRRRESKLKQHDRALKEVTKLKNSARQALRRAKRRVRGILQQ